jgi:LytS/YehU family sensor histidine kinase
MRSMNENNDPQTQPESIKQELSTLIYGLGFSALGVWVLVYENLKFDHWKDWLIVVSTIFSLLMTFGAANILAKDAGVTGVVNTVAVAVKWLLLAPFFAMAVGIAGWLLFSIFGWMGSIPAWAAIIIVILLVKR